MGRGHSVPDLEELRIHGCGHGRREVSFASLPLTKGVTVEFALSVDMVVHRIAVPDELFDSLNTDSTSMSLDVLPRTCSGRYWT